MVMWNNKYLYLLLSLLMVGCSQKEENEIVTIPVRSYISHSDKVSVKKDINRIEYIPLQLTDDNSSMVGQVIDIALTDDYIFVLSDQRCGVLQFDRNGSFVRQIVKYGAGPGELVYPMSLYVTDFDCKLHITCAYKTVVYNFSGDFVEEMDRQGRNSFYSFYLGDNKVVETSFDGMPFQSPGHFGIGVFDEMGKGDTIVMKNNFCNEEIVSPDISGFKFTRCIESDQGVLFLTMTNDTIYRITKENITPVFCWKRDLDNKSLRNAYTLLDFVPTNTDLFIHDIFELPSVVCFRYIYNGSAYIMSYNKHNGEILSMPTGYQWDDLVNIDFWMTAYGVENDIDNGVPIIPMHWYKEKKISIQCSPASTIAYLKEIGKLNTPPEIFRNITGEENPIVILYYLK